MLLLQLKWSFWNAIRLTTAHLLIQSSLNVGNPLKICVDPTEFRYCRSTVTCHTSEYDIPHKVKIFGVMTLQIKLLYGISVRPTSLFWKKISFGTWSGIQFKIIYKCFWNIQYYWQHLCWFKCSNLGVWLIIAICFWHLKNLVLSVGVLSMPTLA